MKKTLISIFSVIIVVFAFSAVVARADHISTDFSGFTPGSINGQQGWLVNSTIDQGIVDQSTQPASPSANRSLRISYGSQTADGGYVMSQPLINEAGETGADNGTLTPGLRRQPHFEAEWDFASADPNYAYQGGLTLIASAERGGDTYDYYSTMAEIFMQDCNGGSSCWVGGIGPIYGLPDGLAVVYFGDSGTVVLASGLSRTSMHHIKISMDFVYGSANDTVSVCVDSSCTTERNLEEYNRTNNGNTQVVRAINFRQGGGFEPETLGKGFFIDNFSILSSGNEPTPTVEPTPTTVPPPDSIEACKGDAWRNFNSPSFKNQGQCISYFLRFTQQELKRFEKRWEKWEKFRDKYDKFDRW